MDTTSDAHSDKHVTADVASDVEPVEDADRWQEVLGQARQLPLQELVERYRVSHAAELAEVRGRSAAA